MAAAGALAHAEPALDSEPAAHLSVVPDSDDTHPTPAPAAAREEAATAEEPRVTNGRAIADQARAQGPAPDPEASFQTNAESLPQDDEVDMDDLVDAPPESVKTPIDRLAEAFPGSELVDDPY